MAHAVVHDRTHIGALLVDEAVRDGELIDAVLAEHDLDAIFTPGASGVRLAAIAAYPHVVVPFGLVANQPTPPFPEGFDAKPRPFGVGFTGAACSEPDLIRLAYAFEQASLRRVAPERYP